MKGMILLIVMKSSKYKVIDIRRKTQAQIFKNIKPGGLLQFSIPIEYAGSNRGKTYASYVKIENLNQEVENTTHKSFNELPRLLSYFTLE